MPAFFMFDFEIGFLGLFLTSFLAATIIPIASEAFLIGMILLGYNPVVCLVVATAGNTLGGWLNYLIGRMGDPSWLKKMGASIDKIKSWKNRVEKYTYWLALFCWLPLIGDFIGITLGFFRAKIFPSFMFMLLGKFLRYLIIVLIYNYW